MKYELNQQVLSNLMIFLDRVSVTGFKEISALNEIVNVLNNPIKEEEMAEEAKV